MNYKWMSFLCDELLWQEAFKLPVSLWIKAKISSFSFLSMRSLRMRRERPLGEDPVPSILIHSLFARHPHVLCMSRLHRWITQWAPLSNLERHRITIKSICLYFLKSEQKISSLLHFLVDFCLNKFQSCQSPLWCIWANQEMKKVVRSCNWLESRRKSIQNFCKPASLIDGSHCTLIILS